MPDLICHYAFGQAFLTALSETERQRLLQDAPLFAFGCNGPDMFYYYHMLPWKKQTHDADVHQLGDIMHGSEINRFFQACLTYLKEHPDHPASRAYLTGFFCHYFLDRSAHPYIFYRSGVQDGTANTAVYSCWHKRFEVAIDERILPLQLHTDIRHFCPADLLVLKDEAIKEIHAALHRIMKQAYGIDLDYSVLRESIRDFHQSIRLLYSKKPYKKNLVLWLEHTLHLKPLISSAMYAVQDEPYDYLNEQHTPWRHPCHPEEIHTESFLDLYQRGLHDMLRFYHDLSAFLQGEQTEDALLEQIGNRCFDTDEPPGTPMLVCDCIYR